MAVAVPSHPTLLHPSLVRQPQGHRRGTSQDPPEPSALSSVGFPFLRDEPRAAQQRHGVQDEEGRAVWEPLGRRLCAGRDLKGALSSAPHVAQHTYFFCSLDKTQATSLHSWRCVSGSKKQLQISAFALPKLSSICVSRCIWCCSSAQSVYIHRL